MMLGETIWQTINETPYLAVIIGYVSTPQESRFIGQFIEGPKDGGKFYATEENESAPTGD